MVSASPETIWFARSVITRNAWMSAIAAPASAATATAAASETSLEPSEPLHGPEPHHRADEHHPLDPEVEHAGALGEQLAQRREEERRPVERPPRRTRRRGSVVHRGREHAGHVVASGARPTPAAATAPAEAEPVADEQLAAERGEEDQPLHHADEARRGSPRPGACSRRSAARRAGTATGTTASGL